MRFLVSDVRNAGHIERNERLDPLSVLGQPPAFVSFQQPMTVKVKAVLTPSDIVVTGHVNITLGFVCARCLENFDRSFDVDFQQVFGVELKEFDITGDIKEAIYIELPITHICKENCLGLCPTCGKNRNIADCGCKTQNERPKWEALTKFPFH